MANPDHQEVFSEGVEAWNAWVAERGDWRPRGYPLVYDPEADQWLDRNSRANLSGIKTWEADLRGIDLSCVNLGEADLTGASLMGADLSFADLQRANLSYADLTRADLRGARLSMAWISEATLDGVDLTSASLFGSDVHRSSMKNAQLVGTDLTSARLIDTDLTGAHLSQCAAYGVSVWNIEVDETTKQSDLLVTKRGEPEIRVDDIEVAQFIHLLLRREKFRNVIDTITSKAVLILGRFTPERKAVLDRIATRLRTHNLLPIVFDFERARARDFTETIRTLAGMSLFVIADITNPKSAPLELQATVPDYQIPFVPIIEDGNEPFSMFRDLQTKYPWVLPPLVYASVDGLMRAFKPAILDEAFELHKRLVVEKAAHTATRSVDDYLQTDSGGSSA